jgi:hypothetical protein
MGKRNHVTTTTTKPSTQRKRHAGGGNKEGGKWGEGRAGKRAAVEVRQELLEPGG